MTAIAAGEQLRAWRNGAGMSEREVAEAVGLRSAERVCAYESGRRLPAAHFRDYAGAVHVSEHEFARTMLKFYEPDLYAALFEPDGRPKGADPLVDRFALLKARVARLERLIAGMD